jgi:hypothetical protein
MGLSVRRYALRLELQNYTTEQCNERMDEEKRFHEDERFADDYQSPVEPVQQWACFEKDSTTIIEVAEKPS